jgi:CHAD domain-containing protein
LDVTVMPLSPRGKWIDAIKPDGTVCAAARLSLEARLMTVAHYLPLAAYHADEDPEHVHRLRVSTRRARAALELYREFLPRKRARWVRRQLKKVRRAAGEARDLDVLAGRLESERGDGAVAVLEFVARERRAVQPSIVRSAERFRRKDKYIRTTARLLEGIDCDERDPSSADPVCFRPWAVQQLSSQAEQFLTSMPDEHANLAALHQFRISAKSLRYSIELLAPGLSPEVRAVHYPTIEELQERLGRINDHVIARERLRQWAADAPDAGTKEMLCELAEEEVASLTAAVGSWREWWTPERVEPLRQGLAQGAILPPSDSSSTPATG